MNNLPTLDIPPIVEIDDEIVESSNNLSKNDVGRWGVVITGGKLILCDSRRDAETIREVIVEGIQR